MKLKNQNDLSFKIRDKDKTMSKTKHDQDQKNIISRPRLDPYQDQDKDHAQDKILLDWDIKHFIVFVRIVYDINI